MSWCDINTLEIMITITKDFANSNGQEKISFVAFRQLSQSDERFNFASMYNVPSGYSQWKEKERSIFNENLSNATKRLLIFSVKLYSTIGETTNLVIHVDTNFVS